MLLLLLPLLLLLLILILLLTLLNIYAISLLIIILFIIYAIFIRFHDVIFAYFADALLITPALLIYFDTHFITCHYLAPPPASISWDCYARRAAAAIRMLSYADELLDASFYFILLIARIADYCRILTYAFSFQIFADMIDYAIFIWHFDRLTLPTYCHLDTIIFSSLFMMLICRAAYISLLAAIIIFW